MQAQHSSEASNSERRLSVLIGARLNVAVVHALTSLGVINLLNERDLSVEEISHSCGCDSDMLMRVLKVARALNLVTNTSEAIFALTPLGKCLVPPHSHMGDYAAALSSVVVDRALQHLKESIETGKSLSELAFGMPFDAYLGQNPVYGRFYHSQLTKEGLVESSTVAESYDFNSVETIVDVGGGHGILLAVLLNRYQHLQGYLLERPSVVGRARRLLDRWNLGDRVQIVSGDFFDEVPTNGDVYILKKVMQAWGADDAQRILETCRKAMTTQDQLFVVDDVAIDTGDDLTSAYADIMSMILGGTVRSEQQYMSLFEASGFELTSCDRLSPPLHLMIGKPRERTDVLGSCS